MTSSPNHLSKVVPIGASERASTESPTDSTLHVSRGIWGAGNVSPVDDLVGSNAIAKLMMEPKSNLGFIGAILGKRLYDFAEETDIWIDACEIQAGVVGTRKRHQSIKLNGWSPSLSLLKANLYTKVIVAQASCVCESLDTVYGQAANALKKWGLLFAVDIMFGVSNGTEAVIRGPTGQKLRTLEEHKVALESAGFAVEDEWDLTSNLMVTIRDGFIRSLEMFGELQDTSEPEKSQRQRALLKQLEIWGPLYLMARKRMISAIGLLVVRGERS